MQTIRKTLRDNKGMTLLEVMLALAIFGMMLLFVTQMTTADTKAANEIDQQVQMMMVAQSEVEQIKGQSKPITSYKNLDTKLVERNNVEYNVDYLIKEETDSSNSGKKDKNHPYGYAWGWAKNHQSNTSNTSYELWMVAVYPVKGNLVDSYKLVFTLPTE